MPLHRTVMASGLLYLTFVPGTACYNHGRAATRLGCGRYKIHLSDLRHPRLELSCSPKLGHIRLAPSQSLQRARVSQLRRPTSASSSSSSGSCACHCRSGPALAPAGAHSMPMATARGRLPHRAVWPGCAKWPRHAAKLTAAIAFSDALILCRHRHYVQ